MSFAKKIEKIQTKPPKEKKIIAILVTSIIFSFIMTFLYLVGAFSIPALSFLPSEKKESFDSIKEDVSALIEDTNKEITAISTSSSSLVDSIKQLASTTASTTEDSVGTTTNDVSTTSLSEKTDIQSSESSSTTEDIKEDKKD